MFRFEWSPVGTASTLTFVPASCRQVRTYPKLRLTLRPTYSNSQVPELSASDAKFASMCTRYITPEHAAIERYRRFSSGTYPANSLRFCS